MALSFVLGGSGTGKSYYIFNQILQEAARETERTFLVIIPEQFSMSTQKALTDLARAHAILNIDVLSFGRLTYRVFREMGEDARDVLEDTGKNLLLRHVIAECEGLLSVLKGGIRRMGYVDEIKSLLTEFDEYCVDDEAFATMIESAATPLLRGKLQDLRILRDRFREKCAGRFVTTQGVMERLAMLTPGSSYLKDATVVLDCFTGFTPVQMTFLKKLLVTARDVYVTLTIDDAALQVERPTEDDLFYITKNSYLSLRQLAGRAGVAVNQDIVLKEPYRLKDREVLRYLWRHFLRPGGKPFASEEISETISLHSFLSIREELSFAAAEITRLVREEGYRYRDICLVSGCEDYTRLAPAILSHHEIPVFADDTGAVRIAPIVTFVKGLLEIVVSGFELDAVMGFLRCGLLPYEPELLDDLENYLVKYRIHMHYQWERPWQDEALDALRETLLKETEKLKCDTAGALTEALYEIIRDYGADEALYAHADALESAGEVRLAQEYMSAYEALMQLFERLHEILGEETMSLQEYADVLCAGLDTIKIGVIPTGLDQVTVGDFTRSRRAEVKVLFLLGAAAGYLPQTYASSGLLSQMERSSLIAGGIEIAPTDKTKTLTSRLYLYNALTAASDKIYLSYSRTSLDGEALKKSYLVADLERRLPGLKDVSVGDMALLEVQSAYGLKRYVYGALDVVRTGAFVEKNQDFGTALAVLQDDGKQFAMLQHHLTAGFAQKEVVRLSEAIAAALYGAELRGSVSKLETYASCAYRYFLRYGLKLYPREVLSFEAPDYGNLLHAAMEDYGKQLMRGEDADAEAAFARAAAVYEETGVFAEPKSRFFLGMMKTTFLAAAKNVSAQLARGKFRIDAVEYAFERQLKGKDVSLLLQGKIDRIDVHSNGDTVYVRVVDYKSGNRELALSDIYYGISLQLVVYIKEALRRERALGHSAKPAGMFYYHIDDPLILTNGAEDDAAIERAAEMELRMKGAFLAGSDVAEAMDEAHTGLVYKTYRDKNCLTEDFYGVMERFVDEKLLSLSGEIKTGTLETNPYRDRNGLRPCEYCDYREICGFDERSGDNYRRLETLDEESLYHMMKGSLNGNEVDE